MSRSTLKMKSFFVIIGLFYLGIANNPVFASNTYCVDASASSAGTGSCWTSPFKELSAALNAATGVGDQILVAKGTYKPAGSARSCTFLLNTNGIAVYGGYPSGGGMRDPVNNLTVLSGDIGTQNDISDNCYHVVTIGSNVKVNAVLDGFTITAGNANNAAFPDYLGGGIISKDGGTLSFSNLTLSNNYALKGGGMYNQGSSPVLSSVVFSNNFATDASTGKAGGMYNYTNSSPILNNVSFIGNASAMDGGGMYNSTNSSPVLTNVIFQSNTATGSGAAIYNYSNSNINLSNATFSSNTATNHAGAIYNSTTSNTILVNCTFSGNTALTGNGGAIYNDTGTQVLNNSTFSNNTASSGSALYNKSLSSLKITNSIFWGNSAGVPIINSSSTPLISYSIVQNSNGSGGSWLSSVGTDAGSNLDNNPLLGSFGNYGGTLQTYALLPNSIAIDSGNLCAITDQRGLVRGGTCDIGAFESQGFTLTKTSGDTQSTSINTSFANPLGISLSSAAGEPIVGGTVTFSDLGTTAKTTLSSAQQISLSSNNASLAAPTANGTTGSYAVQASVRGASAVNFNLTNTAAPVIPTAPSSLVVTAISTTQINLTWVDNSGNETGFKLESPAGTALSTLAANTTSYKHTGLTCGTTYSYSLKAMNSAGDSSVITATASTVACPATIPTAPSSLVATAISATQINLTWVDNSGNETGFKLESPAGTALSTLAVNTTSYNHTGLTCGTTYSYSLKATNSTGDSSAITATASTIACPATIPTAPSSLVATAISATQINLTWVDNSGNETGFKLESPAGTALSTLAANTTSYNHTGLTCGTTYSYSLKATNSTGDSSAITATASTIACPVVIPNYNLGIISAGTGTGIVSGTPAGTYPSGTSIILSALANTGSSFTGWSPSLCGSAFNLTANLNCTAVFDAVPVSPNNYSLTLNKTGTGTGVISGTTAGTYAANTAINLTAVANTGSRFMGWSPSNCASFSLTQNTTCTAIFDSNASATLYNISLKTLGNGAGIVGGTPAGKYAQNTAVNLLAVADSSSEFAGWTPSSCASTFQLTADSTCVATFNLKTVQNFNLALNKTGTGTGTILGTATGVYPKNTRVNLVAVADNGSEFTAWNPSSCGKSFDLLADTYCTAVFDKKPTHIIKPMYNLTLLSSGVSNANLTATPAAPYAAGTQVKLSATAPNAEFLGWQGNGCDSNLTIDRDLICVANFQVLSTGSVRVVDETGNALAQLSEKKSASSIKVRVVRVGNNKGAISVHYQTQAGTALTGIDYQTVSGTLTWANLDNSVKVIEIPVVQNSTHYGDNYLYLLLNSDNPLLELDSHFVKLILQDVLVHSPCNNALQLGANGKLQGNAGCFTHRVNEVELEKASVLPNTPLHIQTLIDTNPQYLGQYAEVLLVAVYFPDPIADPIALQRRGNTWLSWGGALDELSAITRYPSLPKQITVDVFQGTLGNALGRFEVYIGYRLADGSIVFNGLNILEVNVSMP